MTQNASPLTRRRFVSSTGAAVLGAAFVSPHFPTRGETAPKINLGLIGCGGRGKWIADLFAKNGNYNFVAVADYFPDRADDGGSRLGVSANARFSGLNGYKRLLESKLDAVVIESPPYFHPQHASDAVTAGKHVYCAKPIAVDVPGCLTIEETGKRASARGLVFLVDFQTRANEHYQKAVQMVHDGTIGKLVSGEATYACGPTFDGIAGILKQKPNDPETQLRTWGLNRVLSGDIITEQNIHALDVACWIVGSNPLKAVGTGGEARGLGGTCWDHFSVTYWFPEKVLLTFNSKQYGHGWDDICCRMYGDKGTIDTHYFGTIKIKGIEDGYSAGPLANLYTEGAANNVAAFADLIRRGDARNRTVSESVRSNLTTILGRTAAYAGREVSWDEMIRQNERYTFDLSSLRV